MNTKDILLQLRTQKGLSQEQLAEQVFVTRQAVSRWETGETTPNTETLKLLSRLYDVSINTLLGSPQQLICQCCGMPLEDPITSREPRLAKGAGPRAHGSRRPESEALEKVTRFLPICKKTPPVRAAFLFRMIDY